MNVLAALPFKRMVAIDFDKVSAVIENAERNTLFVVVDGASIAFDGEYFAPAFDFFHDLFIERKSVAETYERAAQKL